ncbi:flagellar protein FlgN [Aliidiomarina taiwanensis]|uniref:Flagellar protein FlgN n=1 Tax=Aliidiomarina taiwanensis TaxID=946228 RepID=A0A432X8E5_9GAMM|nr:flagellar export chaperone FlgN [Aliidiomarina taiwanensis]RUO43007.1 flagellar protein FlgN [Aliidiomarina taiwanensis]
MKSESLNQLLDQQLAQLQSLYDTQALELQALEQRNAPTLEELTERKGSLLSAIEQTDNSLAQHPQAQQLSQPEFLEKRERIEQLLQQVHEQNQVNGQVLRLTLGRIQTLKQSLQNMHGENSMTYNEKGHTRSGLSGKGIKA